MQRAEYSAQRALPWHRKRPVQWFACAACTISGIVGVKRVSSASSSQSLQIQRCTVLRSLCNRDKRTRHKYTSTTRGRPSCCPCGVHFARAGAPRGKGKYMMKKRRILCSAVLPALRLSLLPDRAAGTNGEPWCASFVSWCFREAGIPESIMPTSSEVGKRRRSVYDNRSPGTPGMTSRRSWGSPCPPGHLPLPVLRRGQQQDLPRQSASPAAPPAIPSLSIHGAARSPPPP